MELALGPRGTRLLNAWGDAIAADRSGVGYDLTSPTRSERYRSRLEIFIDAPTEANFEDLWNDETLAAATDWYATTVLNLWPDSLEELASFFDSIRIAEEYNNNWQSRVSWGSLVTELYSRTDPEMPVISEQSRRGLRKLGIEPANGFDARCEQLISFRDIYLDIAGHATASSSDPIPVFEEIDQLFALITTISSEDLRAENTGERDGLYTALRGYPGSHATGRGPIEIDFEAATPAIDGHIAARKSGAYKDTETDHWAGGHYESWKWDFANYVSNDVATTYSLENLSPDELEPFFDAFWANADEYTDTSILSTPVPQYLLGRWGVVQLGDFQTQCLEQPEKAARTLSTLFTRDEHLVDRLQQFHNFAASEEVSDGNLLRIATTLLMGVYPDDYVNFQYQRFDTFFSDCSSLDSLETGFDARQYYRVVLACRDIREVLKEELDDASMLDVHTLIRLYQDFKGE
jgi:hypothetical protein